MDYLKNIQNLISTDMRFLSGETLLLTGASGMLGSAILYRIMELNETKELNCKVLALGRNQEQAKQYFSKYWSNDLFEFMQQDMCKPFVLENVKVDYIIHAASGANPIVFSENPVDTLMSNLLGTHSLMQYAVSNGIKRFLYVSSGEMYGQPNERSDDFTEDYSGYVDYSNPRSCYPSGKRATEVLCQSFLKQYGIDTVIARPCHIFGPTMTTSDSRALSQFFRCCIEGQDIELKSSGLLERSHCYVFDAIDAIFFILNKGAKGEAYNIADKSLEMTIRDFALLIGNCDNKNVTFHEPSETEKSGYSKVTRAVLNADKLYTLGWKPNYSIELSVRETLDVLREKNKKLSG